MNYKISIILPIFNVEPFLRAALDSILNQSFNLDNLEVIMVNDCSTDNSGNIIDEYDQKYENFKAIHLEENSGTAGKPRNVGLDYAHGEYIMLLDSDDELMPDICEKLYYKIIESNADIVTANAICIMPNNEVLDIIYPKNYYELNPNKNLELYMPYRIWGTLYKKSLIEDNHIRCIRAATNDDTHFVFNCYLNANKIVYLADYIGVKYYELDSEEFESLTHKMSKFNIISTFDAFIQILDLIKKSHPTKDFVYDPFIKLIYSRFAHEWDMSNQDKKDIFNKVLEYEDKSDYVVKLPIHYRIMDWFLNKKLFDILILIQVIYCKLVWSKFSRKFLFPKIRRNVVGD